MPADLYVDNGKTRAMYARQPAWHYAGRVKEEGYFSAAEALSEIAPEPISRLTAGYQLPDGSWVAVDDQDAFAEKTDDGSWRFMAYNSKEYGLVQIKDQFRFLDEVVGAVDGSHYDAAVRLRKGRQVVLSIYAGEAILDPNDRGDVLRKYIWGFNSFDGSWAFRVKTGDFRVECANMAAMALRGSGDSVVAGDWSTRHTQNILNRAAAAQQTLGIFSRYNQAFMEQAELMINTAIPDDIAYRIIDDLFMVDKDGIEQPNPEATGKVKSIYEFSNTCEKIHGTVWGALNATTEYVDWYTKIRGGKASSVDEARLRRQFGEGKLGAIKQVAYDRFYDWAKDNRRVVVGV